MGDFSTLLSTYAWQMALLFGLGMLVTIHIVFREALGFFYMDLFYGLPWIGKLASLSRDVSRSRSSGWLISEDTLCADYKRYVEPLSEAAFHNRLEYLRKAGDAGRKPLSVVLMLMLGLLIAAEALGFSFLLSTAMAQEGSANLHTLMTFAITAVIASVFALIMHAAGHQLYRSGLISRALRDARMDDNLGLKEQKTDLNSEQSLDDDQPTYQQLVNRVGDTKSYWAVIAAVVFIVSVFVGSTVMRIHHLNNTLIQEAVATSDAGGNPFAEGKAALPDEAAAPQQEALQRAKQESTSATKGEGYAAFVVLGVIFVFTQFVGVMFGMKYGFAGKNSADAFLETLGCATYERYQRVFSPRVHKAKARLRNLQQKIAAANGTKAMEFLGDFDEFLARKPKTVSVAAPAPATAPAPAPAPAPVAAAIAAPETSNLTEAMASYDALDKDQRNLYVTRLSPALRAEVLAEIKARAAVLAELDNLS
jgi:hypothetical protein